MCDRPHAAIVELPASVSGACRQPDTRPRHVGVMADKHGGTSGGTSNTLISAVATIERRPTTDHEATTPSRRSDVDNAAQQPQQQQQQQHQAASTLPRAAMTEQSAMDTSPRRIRPGWSASVRPLAGAAVRDRSSVPDRWSAVDRSSTGTLGRPGDDPRQWRRPASVRWTTAPAGSTGRRPDTTRAALLRSTPDLYYDVRPRLGATHSIVF